MNLPVLPSVCLAMLLQLFVVRTMSQVPAVDRKDIQVETLSDNELDLPYYIYHFHQLANAVETEGPQKGFISLPVWRNVKDNHPYNARIMESIYSLSFFYATDRPWNPYYKNEALRSRLESALSFWCSIQHEDGRFSEYGEKRWNLAATAFATKFMGEAMILLRKAGGISDPLLNKVAEAQRKAIIVVLTANDLFRHGQRFSNQFTNVWPGALSYLALRDDDEVKSLLLESIRNGAESFQSPVGYFYEADGPDWSYNLGTHENNLMMTWHYVKGTSSARYIRQQYGQFLEWLRDNAVPEPGNALYYLNGGISARTTGNTLEVKGRFFQQSIPNSDISPLADAFLQTEEQWQAEAGALRKKLKAMPDIAPLVPGDFNAYTPYGLLQRNLEIKLPSQQEWEQSFRSLPYYTRDSYVRQRSDTRKKATYTFVKNPAYYCAFTSGEKVNSNQTYGIGLLWLPEAGTFLQSQAKSNTAVWGTAPGKNGNVYEASDFYPTFSASGEELPYRPGLTDRNTGQLKAAYSLGEKGNKEISFEKDRIHVKITHQGEISEYFPFLAGCKLTINPGGKRCTAVKNGRSIHIEAQDGTGMHIISDGQTGQAPVVSLRIEGKDYLTYQISFR